MSWDWVDWSNLVWGLAIGVGFMTLELTGWLHLAPWRTLSETIWVDEGHYHILYLLIAAILMGLMLHFLSRIPLWHAFALGLVVAVLSHLIDGWPKW